MENGVALFSTKVLASLEATFKYARCGFGVDLIWPVLLDFPKERFAIIDAVSCIHPKTTKSTLDEVIPRPLHQVQGIELLKKFKLLPASIDKLTPWGEVFNLLPYKVREYDSIKVSATIENE